jgi:hypothetical protein
MKIKEGVWYCREGNFIQIVEKIIKIDGVRPFYAIETDFNTYYNLDYDERFYESMIYIGEL